MQVYSKWQTGNVTWDLQVCDSTLCSEQVMLTLTQSQLPDGATLLGTLISSDKTNISEMTGN